MAMVAKSIESGGRDRIDRLRADQLFHVNHVAVGGILAAGAGPQHPLRLRAMRSQGLPCRAAENFFVEPIGELGIGNRHLAA